MGQQRGPLRGGVITGAERIDDCVHRATGPWTPAVHQLLRHLEEVGFDGAPRLRGFDHEDRELLTYIDGEAGSVAFPSALRVEAGVAAFGRFVREYHDAAGGFHPSDDAVWRIGVRPLRAGEVVCHGDFGHWNTIWRGDKLVAAIDWDFAEPGDPLRDLSTGAITSVPLGDDDLAKLLGYATPVDRRRRIKVLCDAYGTLPSDLFAATIESLTLEIDRLEEFGGQGREPWATLRGKGQSQALATRRDWVYAHSDSFA